MNTCPKPLPLLVNVAPLSSVFHASLVPQKTKLLNAQSLKNSSAVSVNANRPLALLLVKNVAVHASTNVLSDRVTQSKHHSVQNVKRLLKVRTTADARSCNA